MVGVDRLIQDFTVPIFETGQVGRRIVRRSTSNPSRRWSESMIGFSCSGIAF